MSAFELPPLVLVVDDDADIRDTVSEVLVDEGYAVATAKDGAEALEWLAVALPAAILLDLNMPVMDGVEFRRAQLADPRLAKIPTIVMTAVDRMRALIASVPVDHVLAKPVGLDELLAVLAAHVKR